MFENKLYKISHNSGCTLVTGHFYNPITGEDKLFTLRDYDYSDCSRDNDALYYMPVDKEVLRLYQHRHGMILEGDRAMVTKGRKIEHGFVGTVTKIYDWRDCYGRVQATYVVFEDGRKTNINNCVLVWEFE